MELKMSTDSTIQESLTATFPFSKLRYDKFLTLDVMMNVKHFDALKFMFSLNKEARAFLKEHIQTIQNEFDNKGLFIHEVDMSDY